tara:strand:- start:120 stop:392 length:273 start_codon:yes stop_codon:yes gene_type:complete
VPIWWDESERITFDAKARVSKSRAAIERAQEADGKKKNKAHGRYFTAEPRVMDGGEMPTRDEWLKEQEEKKGAPSRQPRERHILQGRNDQ